MKHKILIVDDDENIRLALQYAFADHAVLTAGDGEAAMRLIAAERPSLVLLDVDMPRMSGLEVLLAVKGAEHVPLIIMITGNNDLEMALKALEMGAGSYITKPFEVNTVRKVVNSALADRAAGKKAGDKPWHVKKDGV